jgi:hypothetical protein
MWQESEKVQEEKVFLLSDLLLPKRSHNQARPRHMLKVE